MLRYVLRLYTFHHILIRFFYVVFTMAFIFYVYVAPRWPVYATLVYISCCFCSVMINHEV